MAQWVVASMDGASSLLTAVESGLGVAFGPPAYAVIAGKRARFIPMLPEAPPIQLGVVVLKANCVCPRISRISTNTGIQAVISG